MIWLIGAGAMAKEYAKILVELNQNFKIIGRSSESASTFQEETNIPVIVGGLKQYISSTDEIPSMAIIATNVEQLRENTNDLIEHGTKNILVEKPGGISAEDILAVESKAKEHNTNVLLAYNRRFYSSTQKAQEIIREDGGVKSFNFEFTEWAHIIKDLKKDERIKRHWFLANSTHVVDLAFHLGGRPVEISSFTSGGLDWHPSASCFTGAGKTDKGAIFSYMANWSAPGRWNLEVQTAKHRLIFCPMESLKIQEIGSIAVNEVEINREIDVAFKPGLFKQVQSFTAGDYRNFCSIEQQVAMLQTYNTIANY